MHAQKHIPDIFSQSLRLSGRVRLDQNSWIWIFLTGGADGKYRGSHHSQGNGQASYELW